MKIVALPRQGGKSTKALEWLREAVFPEVRILVAHSLHEAMRLYRSTFDEDDNPTDLHSWQFVSVEEIQRRTHSAIQGDIVLGFDNLDLCLAYLFHWPVVFATITED